MAAHDPPLDERLSLEGIVKTHADVLRQFGTDGAGAWRVNSSDEVAIALRRFANAGLVELNEFTLETREMYRPTLTAKGCVWLSVADAL